MEALSAIALAAPDYDAALSFYVEVMGFELVEQTSKGKRRWARVAPKGRRGASLLLVSVEKKGEANPPDLPRNGPTFLYLESDDIERDHARMVKAGILFDSPPHLEPSGMVAVWLDPFGTRWQLLQRD